MNIPDEAVEAVADIYAESDDTGSLETARAALEAAAPAIIKAWINDTSRLPEDLPGYGPEGRIK